MLQESELQKGGDVEVLILFLITVFSVLMVSQFVSWTIRKILKHTKPLRQNSSNKSPIKSDLPEQSTIREQQKNSQFVYKTKAQGESAVSERIQNFPEAKVEHIIDGDTIIVVQNRQKIKIRLAAIDCPETDQHWGDTARYGLIKLIGGQKVRLEEHGIDRYKRMIATIYVQQGYGSDWMNVNERMVTLGHAWVMRRFYDHLPKNRQNKLNRLESWARSKKIGLWQMPDSIPPWKWRMRSIYKNGQIYYR